MTPDRDSTILAALAPAAREDLTPVQVQKLFFLIDRNFAKELGGALYSFTPYNYGPFDRQVYDDLERLAKTGEIELTPDRTWFNFRLSEVGLVKAQESFSSLEPPVQDYFRRVNEFVRKMSFTQLVAAIYRAYPEMKANSVFQE
jgi:uncharacterized protein YwgA